MNDITLEDNITRILEAKIDMIGAVDPQAGKMLREHFFRE
jgi:hypothetical protein